MRLIDAAHLLQKEVAKGFPGLFSLRYNAYLADGSAIRRNSAIDVDDDGNIYAIDGEKKVLIGDIRDGSDLWDEAVDISDKYLEVAEFFFRLRWEYHQ